MNQFYVLVARTISHSFAALTREILFLPREHKIHNFELACNKHTDDGVFVDFPKISNHFPKVSEDFPKLSRRPDVRSRTFSENFRRLPNTFEEDPKIFRLYTNAFKYNI